MKNNPETIESWSAMLGTIIVIAIVISALWELRRCVRKLSVKQKVPVVVSEEMRKKLSVPHRSLLNLTKLDSMEKEAFSPSEALQKKR